MSRILSTAAFGKIFFFVATVAIALSVFYKHNNQSDLDYYSYIRSTTASSIMNIFGFGSSSVCNNSQTDEM